MLSECFKNYLKDLFCYVLDIFCKQVNIPNTNIAW
jgi:hypothetical protein